MFLVEIQDQFTAGHAVRIDGGAWEKPHTHQWKLRVFLTRPRLNEYAMVVDFHVAGKILRDVLDPLEGKNLNDVSAVGRNPTTELVARYLFDRLTARFARHGVRIKSVAVCEAGDCWAWYTRSKRI